MKNRTEWWKNLLFSGCLLCILYLFYKTVWVLTLLLPCTIVMKRIRQSDQKYKDQMLLRSQFKDMLDSLSALLRTGYSVENALRECLEEMALVHGEDSPICREIRIMCRQKELGFRIEDLFQRFADRTGLEDIETFASVFHIVQKSGGDLIGIMRKTSENLAGKIETGKEIEVVISAKKMELKVISLIPAGILLYMNLTGESLVEPLYGNPAGAVIMTVCLLIYAAAVMLGRKMVMIPI